MDPEWRLSKVGSDQLNPHASERSTNSPISTTKGGLGPRLPRREPTWCPVALRVCASSRADAGGRSRLFGKEFEFRLNQFRHLWRCRGWPTPTRGPRPRPPRSTSSAPESLTSQASSRKDSIRDAASRNALSQLRDMANEPGGFETDELRRLVWSVHPHATLVVEADN